jgi:hypothetical protein
MTVARNLRLVPGERFPRPSEPTHEATAVRIYRARMPTTLGEFPFRVGDALTLRHGRGVLSVHLSAAGLVDLESARARGILLPSPCDPADAEYFTEPCEVSGLGVVPGCGTVVVAHEGGSATVHIRLSLKRGELEGALRLGRVLRTSLWVGSVPAPSNVLPPEVLR